MAEVYASSVIVAPADRVWARIRDFNGLTAWHPLLAESRIEAAAPADQVGCVRAFRLKDGGFIRAKMMALSDSVFSSTSYLPKYPTGGDKSVPTPPLSPEDESLLN